MWSTAFIVITGVLLRYGIGLAGYSGSHEPPGFGDYEVHRHWMELGVNLPAGKWYQESEQEYAYKGVDYPPFCMYLHYVMGQIMKRIIPEAFVYNISRGYESDPLKFFMRSSIVVLDLAIFFSGMLYFIYTFYKNLEFTHKSTYALLALHIPCLLLIDHGHFHHNCVMLGILRHLKGRTLLMGHCVHFS